ncbi:Phthiodiolone/phenolphthiodiolone dimycocerosates ketoreductase [bacterium HR12]|nr:Phthiodiolone/phenolphthiodiolone dimycocerosates ketoreductase [bacterium HR12]
MRVGLALPHYDFSLPDGGPVSFERVAEIAVRAERLGFDSVWVSDHFFTSLERYGGPAAPQGSLEPLATLAGLAVRTERVRLGTLVLSASFRHPAILAKSATAIDLLSGGRLDLGLGAGWYEREFEAFGYRFGPVGERFALLEEVLEVLVRLLPGGPASYEGERFRLHEAFNHPPPAQEPRPPIWVGGKGGPRLLRLAARLADGWNTAWRWTPEAYAERVAAARAACERVGRDPGTLRLSLGLFTVLGEDERDLRRRYAAMAERLPTGVADAMPLELLRRECLAGTPGEALERLARFAELGVEELVVSPAPIWFSLPDPSMLELVAEAVIPGAHAL